MASRSDAPSTGSGGIEYEVDGIESIATQTAKVQQQAAAGRGAVTAKTLARTADFANFVEQLLTKSGQAVAEVLPESPSTQPHRLLRLDPV
jgi:hypothetical protein